MNPVFKKGPRKEIKSEVIYIKVTPNVRKRFLRLCKHFGMSYSEILEAMVTATEQDAGISGKLGMDSEGTQELP
ncbi:MAG: hypothetical protein J6F33_05595 [Acidaminococcaceae bacterium]|nr:hypothetical protein [Acidaminococcaceae bacterium]